MYGYLEGKLKNITPSQVNVDINGVGYEVQLTLNTYEAIRDKEACLLYTHLQVRDDAWTLYGFFTEKEKLAFQKLLTISGVGAATARILLSSITPDELINIVANADSHALQKVKGIGSKTAQRIILELKGKLPDIKEDELNGFSHNTTEKDALNALIGLGISKTVAEAALKKTKKAGNEDSSVEERIKEALKSL